jgi:hypothetical protein
MVIGKRGFTRLNARKKGRKAMYTLILALFLATAADGNQGASASAQAPLSYKLKSPAITLDLKASNETAELYRIQLRNASDRYLDLWKQKLDQELELNRVYTELTTANEQVSALGPENIKLTRQLAYANSMKKLGWAMLFAVLAMVIICTLWGRSGRIKRSEFEKGTRPA